MNIYFIQFLEQELILTHIFWIQNFYTGTDEKFYKIRNEIGINLRK